MLTVITRIRAAPGKGDAMAALLRDQLSLVRAGGPRTFLYPPQRSTNDPDLFLFQEQYADEAAFEPRAHAAQLDAFRQRVAVQGLAAGAADDAVRGRALPDDLARNEWIKCTAGRSRSEYRRARRRAAGRAADGLHRGSRGKPPPDRLTVLFAAYEARCLAAGVKPKSKRAVAAALGARFAKCKANGGDVHYGAQLRKGLTVGAAA